MSSGDEPPISILDARLAEIDRRLQGIQSGLGETKSQAPTSPPASPPPSAFSASGRLQRSERSERPPRVQVPGDAPPGGEMLDRLRELTDAQEGVLASMRELLGTLEELAVAAPAQPETAPVPPMAAPAHHEAQRPVTVSAGPFTSTAAVHGFERALEALPGVRAVEVRGFEGGDRAILDVHLA